MDSPHSILITGASGGLASIVVDMLAERFRLVGVDPRELPPKKRFPGIFHRIHYTQRQMAEVFRQDKFHALIHLGRVPSTAGISKSKRYNLNVLGTRNLLNLALKYGVKNIIVFSTYHVYGAHQHNHLHITEDEPLRASQIFPELSDAIELDHFAKTFSLQYPEIRTIILRPVNVIGSRIQNEITRLLRSEHCPTLLGYDPMMQFIHERDIAKALRLCLESHRSGVYNVAGEGMIPYTKAIELAGSIPIPVPHFLAYPLLGALSRVGFRIPKHLIDYFRYPTIVSDAAFRKDFGYNPDVTTLEAFKSI